MWLYDRWGTSLHVCRAEFQLLAPASWEIHTRFITQIRQWSILRSRDHISGPLSFQKLMSGSTDSRILALYFTHLHLCAIRPSGEMLAGAHFTRSERIVDSGIRYILRVSNKDAEDDLRTTGSTVLE